MIAFLSLPVILAASLAAQAQETPSPPERPEYRINAAGRISTRGLISAWRGDGSAADRASRNHGTIYGGVTFVPAMVGQGFRFNGVDGRISVPDAPSLRIAGSLTITCWIWVESFPTLEQGAGMILFRGDDRTGADPYHLQVDPSGRVRFAVETENKGADISAPIGAGRFVHVAATLDVDTGRMRLYENGALVAETTTTFGPMPNLDAGANPALGIGNHGGQPNSPHRYPFHGVINELMLYGRALSPGEIRAMVQDRLDTPALDRLAP